MPGSSYNANYSSSDKSGVDNSPINNGNVYGFGGGVPPFPFATGMGEGTTQTTISKLQGMLPLLGLVGVAGVGAFLVWRLK